MRRFAQLYEELDATNKTLGKVSALKRYFEEAPEEDRIWALALLSGRRPRRQVNSSQLRSWALELARIPLWLFEESYHVVGDLGETVSLLLPEAEHEQDISLSATMAGLAEMDKIPEEERKQAIQQSWMSLTKRERLVFTKLITGSFRVGVSESLVIRAIAQLTDIEAPTLTHRLTGNWVPVTTTWQTLIYGEEGAENEDASKPYPFFLAYAVDDPAAQLGESTDWQAEWKWDGIRSQLIRRKGESFIWSRGEDLVTERFPELKAVCETLPEGTVIDGEILPFIEGRIANFGVLQTRLGRKNVSAKILKDAPVICCAYDLIEYEGQDIRTLPLSERRERLEAIVQQVNQPALTFSGKVLFDSWENLAETRLQSRENQAEGFMIKRLSSTYQVGRRRGDWWKWKVDPMSVDAVMIYAQRGHGRRADLYTDYTFGIWDGDKLVPFAKAYSGLTDVEIGKVDRWVKANTLEKFGPVRTVKPELVFEIGFEGIQISTRHKSGIAVRFPRILRWRHDKPIEEADTLEGVKALVG